MKTISIPIANSMPEGCKQPEPVTIEINQPISDAKKEDGLGGCHDLDLDEVWNKSKADKLADALLDALPQCLIEPLIIGLMARRVSLYYGVMEKSMRKRPVELLRDAPYKRNEERGKVTIGRGDFCMWGQDTEEDERGFTGVTVAIVEMPDGEVRTVYPPMIKFLGKE